MVARNIAAYVSGVKTVAQYPVESRSIREQSSSTVA